MPEKIYCVLRHVSPSGLTRWVALFKLEDGELRNITYRAAKELGKSYSARYDGIAVRGVGTDTGWVLVDALSRVHGKTYEHEWL